MSELVRYESGETFSTITMDDGRANVMSIAMLEAINRALDRAEADKAIVLLCGREKIFSGGFDLATFQQGKEPLFNMLKAGAETAERMLAFPQPIVAAVGGHAIAMGLFLVLAADLRIGARGEYRLHANEVEIGLTLPRFAIEVCRQRMTPAAFSRATIMAEPFSPEEAREAGILDALVAKEDLMKAAQEKSASLARLNRGAHTGTKLRVRANALEALRAAIETDVAEWRKAF
jgi:enoyl-CoA hydratase